MKTIRQNLYFLNLSISSKKQKQLIKTFLILFLFFVSISPTLFSQDFNNQPNDDSVVVKPDYRNHLNIPEYNPGLMPLNRQASNTGVWTELNPKVPRVDYLGIHFVNKDTGWAVGANGTIIKTTDGGNSWTNSISNTTTPILKVRSYNGQIVIASGYAGTILRSTDGGEIFVQVTSNVMGDLWGLQMLNDTLAWACGISNSLIKTTDGGQTWQRILTPGYTTSYWWIDFMNENYGFIAADGKVLKTTDGGNNWEIIQAGDAYPLFCVDVIDSLHIAAAGYGGTSYRGKNIYSSDAGYTWINGGPLTFEAVNCIQYLNPDTGYLVMTNVSARKTTNRGQEWTTIQGISDNFELQFLENNNGYSSGTEVQINKAEINLDIWHRLIINDNFADVFFVSEQKGFAISSALSSTYNALYSSSNGGVTWESVPGAPSGSELFFIDTLIGFIGNYTIFKTTDGGLNWGTANIVTTGEIQKIFFIDSLIGWAATQWSPSSDSKILKTTDGGFNWLVQVENGIDEFTSIYFFDSLNGWATSRYIWQTTNGGQNWIKRTNIPIYFSNDVYFSSLDTGFVIEFLDLYKTTNSGNNWFAQLNSQYIIREFGWISALHGFIMGDGVYETTDRGNTWNEILELRNIGIRKFQAPKNYVGYSVGDIGLVYKYIDTTIVPVELVSFTGFRTDKKVQLEWQTATELNNAGFEIQKSSDKEKWINIGFVEGNGTTTIPNAYTFIDDLSLNHNRNHTLFYRLKQIDFDGSFKYSRVIEIEVLNTTDFILYQNFPNPFNPKTIIKYSIPSVETNRDASLLITLKVYDILGNEIATLVSEEKPAGTYEVMFEPVGLTSGVYFYKLISGGNIQTRKLIFMK